MLVTNKAHAQDTTSFAFEIFGPNSTGLIYQGDAHVPPLYRILRLTGTDSSGNPRRESVGRVLYSAPVQFWESGTARQAYFETTIRFFIRPVDNDPADGIAFFIAPVGTDIPSGSAGGNLGIFGPSGTSPFLFAVEFDTYVNGQWDPSYRHVGININSRNSRNVTRLENVLRQEVIASIKYEATTRVISVVATAGGQIYRVSYVFDLKTILPQQVQVGISSATGQAVAIHDVLSWCFTSTLVREPPTDVEDSEETYIRQYVM